MMSVCTFGRIRRPPALVSSRYRLSGVVTRMWGGCFVMAARSLVGVSPVRTATRMGTSCRPRSFRIAWMPFSGTCRLAWMSLLRAFRGDT